MTGEGLMRQKQDGISGEKRWKHPGIHQIKREKENIYEYSRLYMDQTAEELPYI